MRDADETKSKEALPESEWRRMALYDHIPGMVYRGRADWSAEIICNSEQICGYSAGEFERGEVNWLDIVHPDDRDGVYEEGSGLVQRSGQLVQVYRITTKDGDVRWVEDHKTSSFDDDGALIGIDGVVFDITERIPMEAALRQSEQRYKTLVENLPQRVFLKDCNSTYVSCNENFARDLGISPELLPGKSDYDLFSRELAEKYRADDKRVMESGEIRDIEERAVLQGREMTIHTVKTPVRNEEGNVTGVLGIFWDITKRKRLERALSESEEKFRIITEQSFDVVFAADLDGTLTYASPSVERVFGYRPDEVIGRNAAELVPESEVPKVVQQFKDITAGKDVEGEEVQMRRKDGSIGIIEMNSGPVCKDGKIIGAQVSARDITRRKKAEDEIRKFKTISDRAGYGMAMVDPEGRVIYINESFAKMHGYSPEMLIGKDLSVFHNEEQMENVKRLNERLLRTGTYTGEEVWHKRRDGTVFPTLMNGTLINDAAGKPLLLTATAVDITRRKEAESALREGEERYRALVESAGETIATIDRNGVYLFINKTGADRFGGKPEDYVGKTMRDSFPKEVADRHIARVRAVIETGQGINVIMPTELKGQVRWYSTTIEPLRDSSGKVVAALVVARDIHDVRLAEIELEAYQEKMARAERLASLGTLSATLAHELTQPLTVIALSIENSLSELEKESCSQAVIEGLRDSLEEVSSVTSIVDRFRRFARKSSGKTVDIVDLKAVAERIVKLLGKRAQDAKVKLRLEGMGELPRVYLNDKELEQLFFALVENAIQASDGSKVRELVIAGVVKGEHIELRFLDNCGGIEAQNVDKIFEPFFTTKSANEGTGLGLCIVRRVAERSGGRVRVENRPGEGATFIVTLGINGS